MNQPGDETTYEVQDRRPMPPREWAVMRWLTDGAIRLGLSANAVSVLSVAFAVGSAVAMCFASADSRGPAWQRVVFWLVAAIGIELRAFCNLLDGMVAVKTQTASPVGELYNEVPDRLSDIAMLVGFGIATGHPTLGTSAACAAVLVAYVRAQAAAAGAGQDYCGPMAKPARMQIVALACVLMAVVPMAWRATFWGPQAYAINGPYHQFGWFYPQAVLWLILLGCVLTTIRRLRRASRRLRERVA